ncbi:hypothetical protein HK101_006690, partial [Irineochytrium annulatum]
KFHFKKREASNLLDVPVEAVEVDAEAAENTDEDEERQEEAEEEACTREFLRNALEDSSDEDVEDMDEDVGFAGDDVETLWMEMINYRIGKM